MKTPHEELLEKVVDLIYGSYDPKDFTEEQQKENIRSFRERIIRWKIDPKIRKILGRLQPANLLSQMTKVPENEITRIMKEFNLVLPDKPDMKEFNIDMIPEDEVRKILKSIEENPEDEGNVIELLAAIEKNDFESFSPSGFEFIDMSDREARFSELKEENMSNVHHMIRYLENSIEKIKRGEVNVISLISVMNDGKASVYLPPALTDQIDLYSPIIDLLRIYGKPTQVN